MLKSVVINSKYSLSLLEEIEKDDINFYLSSKKGIYVCSFPDEQWHKQHNLVVKKNYATFKKSKFLSCLKPGSFIVSPTEILNPTKKMNRVWIGNVFHLGSHFKYSRLKQIEYSLKLIFYLTKIRKNYDVVLYYNFELPIFFTALFVRHILGKEIYVDFEDDYSLIKRNWFKNYFTKLIYQIPNSVICINREMKKHFGTKTHCLVFNGFIDLNYLKEIDVSLREDLSFLYAGTLDEIRGADLLPEIVYALRKQFSYFRIRVTGFGPLDSQIRDLKLPEIEFLGFLSEDEYVKVLKLTDIFLVLQKPDHAFNKGSFPSKIEYYSAFKKPIYSLKLNK